MTAYGSGQPSRGIHTDGETINALDTHQVVMGSDGTDYIINRVDAAGNSMSVITDGTDNLGVITIDSAYGATPTALPMAGKYEATPTAYADGDATPFLTDANGRLITVSAGLSALVETFTHGSALLTKAGGIIDCVTYSPGAGTEYISGYTFGGSGITEVHIQFGTTASETDLFVFYNSSSNPNIIHNFPVDLDIASTETFVVAGENLEIRASPASDFTGYGTIISHA